MPFIHGLKSRRTRRKNRQKKAKRKSSSRSSKQSSSKSPKTRVKRSMAATKIQRTLKKKKTQRLDRQNRAALIRALNLTPAETQGYMHLHKNLGENRDAPDIILDIVRNERQQKSIQNSKNILKIADLLEVFESLYEDFQIFPPDYEYSEQERDEDYYGDPELKERINILTQFMNRIKKEPNYSDNLTNILIDYTDNYEDELVQYLEEKWVPFFENQPTDEYGAGFDYDSVLYLSEFMHHYNNDTGKYY